MSLGMSLGMSWECHGNVMGMSLGMSWECHGNVTGYFFSLSTKTFSRHFLHYMCWQKFLYSKNILIYNDIFLSHYVGIHLVLVGIQCSLIVILFMIDYKHQHNLTKTRNFGAQSETKCHEILQKCVMGNLVMS